MYVRKVPVEEFRFPQYVADEADRRFVIKRTGWVECAMR